jgi:hypothetical protein
MSNCWPRYDCARRVPLALGVMFVGIVSLRRHYACVCGSRHSCAVFLFSHIVNFTRMQYRSGRVWAHAMLESLPWKSTLINFQE